MFRKLTRTRNWILGSLESDGGSEYSFGYDPDNHSLMWLEAAGQEYGPEDDVWSVAVNYIESTLNPQHIESSVVVHSVSAERPKTVTRSTTAEWTDPYPMGTADERVVGDRSPGMVVDDDDIAAQAEKFLLEQGGEFE